MELIKHDVNIDFISHAKLAIGISIALILIGAASFLYHGGPSYGVDFAGGTVVQLKFKQTMDIAQLRQALAATEIAGSEVQDFGQAGDEFMIRLQTSEVGSEDVATIVQKILTSKFGDQSYEIRRIEAVGPKVGKDLRRKGILAVLFSTVMMGIYIAFRFEPRFGIGAATALVHDVLITAGALSLMNLEFDLTVVAALLTVIGFSVNDTVIVADRIRENMRKLRRETMKEIINRSINETLSRTIITTGTATLVILALLFLGGQVIYAFAFTLLVGFLVGTYSSIYVASPIVLWWEKGGSRK